MAGKLSPQARRINAHQLQLDNPFGVDATCFANEDVPVERDGIEQLHTFLSIQRTVEQIQEAQQAGTIEPFWGDNAGSLQRVVLTPDFHKGGGIPVGTVAHTSDFLIPQAVGNDVCCGMRLLVTDLTRDQVMPILTPLMGTLRRIFFEGKRQLPMTPTQRRALLHEGLWGVWEHAHETKGLGLWQLYDATQQERDLQHVHFQGVLSAQGSFAFDDYIKAAGNKASYDSQIGSVGGGNHFVELQVVEDIMDNATAHAWGLKPEAVVIMAHSGSVGLGHLVGGAFRDAAKEIYPKELAHPEHGFYLLPTSGPHAALAASYLDAMANAANFAFANRLWLGLMVVKALSDQLNTDVNASLLYDAPHNLIWEDDPEPGAYTHRKGACPAYGPEHLTHGPFQYTGQPVIIPGSMGASSYVMAGRGNTHALCSACHGAGRSISRGKARHIDEQTYREAIAPLRIVTPIDPDAHNVRSRRDILDKYHQQLKEEGPFAYKSITSVVQTVTDASIASPVARTWPLLTIKG